MHSSTSTIRASVDESQPDQPAHVHHGHSHSRVPGTKVEPPSTAPPTTEAADYARRRNRSRFARAHRHAANAQEHSETGNVGSSSGADKRYSHERARAKRRQAKQQQQQQQQEYRAETAPAGGRGKREFEVTFKVGEQEPRGRRASDKFGKTQSIGVTSGGDEDEWGHEDDEGTVARDGSSRNTTTSNNYENDNDSSNDDDQDAAAVAMMATKVIQEHATDASAETSRVQPAAKPSSRLPVRDPLGRTRTVTGAAVHSHDSAEPRGEGTLRSDIDLGTTTSSAVTPATAADAFSKLEASFHKILKGAAAWWVWVCAQHARVCEIEQEQRLDARLSNGAFTQTMTANQCMLLPQGRSRRCPRQHCAHRAPFIPSVRLHMRICFSSLWASSSRLARTHVFNFLLLVAGLLVCGVRVWCFALP